MRFAFVRRAVAGRRPWPCPECDEVIILPEHVKAGDTVSGCGQTYTLTFEFGAFAAEKM